MSPFGLKFSQIILHTETSKQMYNWSFLLKFCTSQHSYPVPLISHFYNAAFSPWESTTFQCIIFLYHLIFFLHPLSVLIFLPVLHNFLIKTVLNASFLLCNVINFTNKSIFTVWFTCIFKTHIPWTHPIQCTQQRHGFPSEPRMDRSIE